MSIIHLLQCRMRKLFILISGIDNNLFTLKLFRWYIWMYVICLQIVVSRSITVVDQPRVGR